MGLESLVSEDSRRPIEKLRRVQIQKLLKAHGVNFDVSLPKTALLPILEGSGIDITKPLPTGESVLQQVPVQDENGNTKIEYFPAQKEHATARKNIDYDTVIEQTAKNNTPDKMSMMELRSAAKELGINTFKMKKEHIIKAIENVQNASERDQ